MELLLWRWSTAVQVTSMVMIAVFFAAFSRSTRRPELRIWLHAWLADLAALALALGFWYVQPDVRYHHPFFALYLISKMSFVLFMLQGAFVLRGRDGWVLRNRLVLPALAAFSIVSAFLVDNTDQLGLVAYPVMGFMFLAAAAPLVRPLSSGTAWLGAGFLTRALLLFGETAAYAVRSFPGSPSELQAHVRLFISAASSFDSAAEWLIALGCVLAVSNRIQRELSDANAELREAQALAQQASLAKSVFLSNVSHELRTPLNAVIGFAQLVTRSHSIGAEDRENVAIIRRSGEHLLGLINEVLSISRIEAGKLALEPRAFDPQETIASVTSMIRGRAAGAGLDLVVDVDASFPPVVRGDESKLRQALLNLLGNAVKFTASGSVTLRARWHDGRVALAVSDTGHGIAESELRTLFEPFVQTESGRLAHEGTGLGLAITRELVRLMGGEISVTSRLGEGTTFSFEVELPRAEEAPSRSANRVIGMEAGERAPRILVVDDTAEGRLLLGKLLGSVGCTVDEAGNGEQAIALWKAGHHDLIFMDNRMPVMDGSVATEAIRRLEKDEAHRPVIVAVTASVFEHERGSILDRGADDFVMKPFDEERIFEVLASRLGVRFRREMPGTDDATAIGETTAVGEDGGGRGPRLRVHEGIRNASGNALLYRDLLHSFKRDYADAPVRLSVTGDGSDEESLLLHSLRGIAATLGAADVATEAGRMELSLRRGERLALEPLTRLLAETIAEIDDYEGRADPEPRLPVASSGAPSPVARRLDRLLSVNDLSAIDCYRELAAIVGPSPSLLPLRHAVEQLDFEAARSHLRRLEAELRL